MSDMKEISLRELHRNTGAWVRSARKHGLIVVRDRNVPVAAITPLSEMPAVNRFERWAPQRRFARALARPVGGTPVEDIVSADRDR
jgi:antitoxin (DNA-binding transcriptional repressor) of toxin-antitoxin stability system